MVFRRIRRFVPSSVRLRMILEHSLWLTDMERSGREVPRIPTRRVTDGGFATLMATEEGRLYASSWWSRALHEID